LVVKQLWDDQGHAAVQLGGAIDLSQNFKNQDGWSKKYYVLPSDLGAGIWAVTLRVDKAGTLGVSGQDYIAGSCVVDTVEAPDKNMCVMDLFYSAEEPVQRTNTPPRIVEIVPPVPVNSATKLPKKADILSVPMQAPCVMMDDYAVLNGSRQNIEFEIAVHVWDEDFSSSPQDESVRLLPVNITEIGRNEKGGRVAPGCGMILDKDDGDPWASHAWPGATKNASRKLTARWLPFAGTNASIGATEYGESFCALTFAATDKYTQGTQLAQNTVEFTVGGQSSNKNADSYTPAPVLVYSLQGSRGIVVSTAASQSSTFLQTQFSSPS